MFKLLLGVVMALVLTSRIRWRSFWTGVLLIPWVAPTVVSALNFLWIFDGSLGVLNYLLVRVFRILPQGVGWLSEPGTAMASVIAVNIWRGFPFFGISFLAGMKGIPAELYEAAAVDGAGAWQTFRHITFPLLQPAHYFVATVAVIGGLQMFDQAYIGGGPDGSPNNALTTIVLFIYRSAIADFDFGFAAAVGVVLFAIIFTATLIQRRLFGQTPTWV